MSEEGESGQEWNNIRLREDEELDFFTELALHETERWIQAITRKKFAYPDDFRRSLSNGVLMCELLNELKPGTIKRINKLPGAIAGLDNVNVFLNACEKQFGLQKTHLFDPNDLEDLSNRAISDENEELLKQEVDRRSRNVAITIFWLGKSVAGKISGPTLDTSAFSALVHSHGNKQLISDDSFKNESWQQTENLINQEKSNKVQSPYSQHNRDSSYDSLGSYGPESDQSFDDLDGNMPVRSDMRGEMKRAGSTGSLSRDQPLRLPSGSDSVFDRYDSRYGSSPDISHAHTRSSSNDSMDGGFNHSRNSSGSTENYPTRRLSTNTRKPSTSADPLQFVKLNKAEDLAKSALQQMEASKVVNKMRPVVEATVNNEDQDWQSNFDSWKSKRRKSTPAFQKIGEAEGLFKDEEEAEPRVQKTKTFSQIMAEKNKRKSLGNLNSYPFDDDDSGFGGRTEPSISKSTSSKSETQPKKKSSKKEEIAPWARQSSDEGDSQSDSETNNSHQSGDTDSVFSDKSIPKVLSDDDSWVKNKNISQTNTQTNRFTSPKVDKPISESRKLWENSVQEAPKSNEKKKVDIPNRSGERNIRNIKDAFEQKEKEANTVPEVTRRPNRLGSGDRPWKSMDLTNSSPSGYSLSEKPLSPLSPKSPAALVPRESRYNSPSQQKYGSLPRDLTNKQQSSSKDKPSLIKGPESRYSDSLTSPHLSKTSSVTNQRFPMEHQSKDRFTSARSKFEMLSKPIDIKPRIQWKNKRETSNADAKDESILDNIKESEVDANSKDDVIVNDVSRKIRSEISNADVKEESDPDNMKESEVDANSKDDVNVNDASPFGHFNTIEEVSEHDMANNVDLKPETNNNQFNANEELNDNVETPEICEKNDNMDGNANKPNILVEPETETDNKQLFAYKESKDSATPEICEQNNHIMDLNLNDIEANSIKPESKDSLKIVNKEETTADNSEGNDTLTEDSGVQIDKIESEPKVENGTEPNYPLVIDTFNKSNNETNNQEHATYGNTILLNDDNNQNDEITMELTNQTETINDIDTRTHTNNKESLEVEQRAPPEPGFNEDQKSTNESKPDILEGTTDLPVETTDEKMDKLDEEMDKLDAEMMKLDEEIKLESQVERNADDPFTEKMIKINQKPNNNKGFGFTLVGGVEKHQPVTVQRVNLGSAADVCEVEANDELISVNGRDVSTLTLAQVQGIVDHSVKRGQIEIRVKRYMEEGSYDSLEEEEAANQNRMDTQSSDASSLSADLTSDDTFKPAPKVSESLDESYRPRLMDQLIGEKEREANNNIAKFNNQRNEDVKPPSPVMIEEPIKAEIKRTNQSVPKTEVNIELKEDETDSQRPELRRDMSYPAEEMIIEERKTISVSKKTPEKTESPNVIRRTMTPSRQFAEVKHVNSPAPPTPPKVEPPALVKPADNLNTSNTSDDSSSSSVGPPAALLRWQRPRTKSEYKNTYQASEEQSKASKRLSSTLPWRSENTFSLDDYSKDDSMLDKVTKSFEETVSVSKPVESKAPYKFDDDTRQQAWEQKQEQERKPEDPIPIHVNFTREENLTAQSAAPSRKVAQVDLPDLTSLNVTLPTDEISLSPQEKFERDQKRIRMQYEEEKKKNQKLNQSQQEQDKSKIDTDKFLKDMDYHIQTTQDEASSNRLNDSSYGKPAQSNIRYTSEPVTFQLSSNTPARPLMIDPRNQGGESSSDMRDDSKPEYVFQVGLPKSESSQPLRNLNDPPGMSPQDLLEQERQRIREEERRKMEEEKKKWREEQEREFRREQESLRAEREKLQQDQERISREKAMLEQEKMQPSRTYQSYSSPGSSLGSPISSISPSPRSPPPALDPKHRDNKAPPPTAPKPARGEKARLTRDDLLAMNRSAKPLTKRPEGSELGQSQDPAYSASTREAPTKVELHSLNAVPKQRVRSSGEWIGNEERPFVIGKRSDIIHKSNNSNSEDHWLVQEAERRRKQEQLERRNNMDSVTARAGPTKPSESSLVSRFRGDIEPPPRSNRYSGTADIGLSLRPLNSSVSSSRSYDRNPDSGVTTQFSAKTQPVNYASPNLSNTLPANFSFNANAPIPSKTPRSINSDTEPVIAVSGKQKCSHCGEELAGLKFSKV